MKKRMLLALMLTASANPVYAEQAYTFDKEVTLKPSAPYSSPWVVNLPPKASAKLTVVVEKFGDVGTTPYKLKPGPIEPEITSTAVNGVLWMKTREDNTNDSKSFVFNVANTAPVTKTSTTVTVKCVWEPIRNPGGGGGGGGGGGTPLPDISGLAVGIASLPTDGSCAWSFETDTQLADGVSPITWKLQYVDGEGQSQPMIFKKIEVPNLNPATASWAINPDVDATSPVLSGTVKSHDVSSGNLKAIYTEGGVPKESVADTKLHFKPVEINVNETVATNDDIVRKHAHPVVASGSG